MTITLPRQVEVRGLLLGAGTPYIVEDFSGLTARAAKTADVPVAVLAYELNIGFVPIRKKGKLPYTTVAESYELEYGSATVEMHTDAVREDDRVLLIDDLIATGGTMLAGKRLLERLGATVIEGAAIVELPDLGGAERLRASGLPLFTLVSFGGH